MADQTINAKVTRFKLLPKAFISPANVRTDRMLTSNFRVDSYRERTEEACRLNPRDTGFNYLTSRTDQPLLSTRQPRLFNSSITVVKYVDHRLQKRRCGYSINYAMVESERQC